MIPISNYATVAEDATLQEAVLSLRKSYCELETGMCTEAGPRTILVIDKREQLVGILDFRSFPGGIGYSGTGGLKPTPWVPGGSGPAYISTRSMISSSSSNVIIFRASFTSAGISLRSPSFFAGKTTDLTPAL